MGGYPALRPPTQFASVGDADIAFQAFGEGPDVLCFYSVGFSTQTVWQVPMFWDFHGRLASVCRVIVFDRRGSGASDPVPNETPTWETLAEDTGAVLDAAGSRRAAILATTDAGPGAMLFAATHPDRVSALILLNSYARYVVADDYPIGVQPEFVDWICDTVRTQWGRGWALLGQPGAGVDEASVDRLTTMFLSSATPRAAARQFAYILRDVDARSALPLITAPTLVVHTSRNNFVSVEHSRYLVDHIPGAKFIEYDVADIFPIGETTDALADEIAELVAGHRPADAEHILATVLFTDIVDSTAKAAAVGDRKWRSLLDAHDELVRDQLRRFRGDEVKTTGDGFVATFSGPARAIRCAHAITEAVHGLGIDVRAGLHTGECEVRAGDLGGVAVHIAARVVALAASREVLVSSTVKDLVIGSGLEFDDRGEHELKGVPGSWKLYALRERR